MPFDYRPNISFKRGIVISDQGKAAHLKSSVLANSRALALHAALYSHITCHKFIFTLRII